MISAIITGAGSSSRFGSNKLLKDLGGKPLIIRTIENFMACDLDEIILTSKREDLATYLNLIDDLGPPMPIHVVVGGDTRVESLMNGLIKSKGDLIITHDGARPLTRPSLIKRTIDEARRTGAVMTALNPTATVKVSGDDMKILRSLPRDETWIAQTPQGFSRKILEKALDQAIAKKYFVPTDDSELVSVLTGTAVSIVEGDPENIKVTFPIDLKVARMMLEEER